ncbi:TetR/AcrR family transcriptional regulator [Rhodoplanes sp. TEM]|uniref:TetR/AcrR family transcriptional regulator n=1 Tax=Rhodoplanes tepidamans TaxID=200616 RepID=A0ABT5JIQ3_RHOTP|nr:MULTISPECIES: TetR/AcrR family transcriptional regulator [Rhodoplanes]MDC7789583.1 TetR/AcrR family transcriptional regulator [Rhodoplanes tepidamans]MDC7986629.1 TetR/AcrR family transcriptional regulator [Rhodoplanes sp. TEM]MDQ0357273.1 AcrR family transcriptional regulator [Rhodoplanes tepidamans]
MPYRRTERVIERLAARRDDILASARAVAAAQGLAGVQIVPVAERAGIAAGTVYRYFPAKADLVAALLEQVSGQEVAAMVKAAAAAPGPLSGLAAAVTTFAGRALRQRRLVFAVLSEPVEPDIEPQRRACRRAITDVIEGCIRTAVATGRLPEQDTRIGADAILGALVEALIGPSASIDADPAKQKDAVQAMVLLVLRALGVVDARARGLVVQAPWPAEEAA